jgi:hypothetical protein
MNFDPVKTTSLLAPLATNEFPPIGSPHVQLGELGVSIAGSAALTKALNLVNTSIPAFTLQRTVYNALSTSDLIMVNYPTWTTLIVGCTQAYKIVTYSDNWVIEAGGRLNKIVNVYPGTDGVTKTLATVATGTRAVNPPTVYTVLFITSVSIASTLPAAAVVMLRAFYNLLA